MSKRKKYHYIYKTTCKITGKFYIGMHSTDNLDDGYLGSGKILGYSRNKYGDENHVKEIVEYCASRDELKKREREIVNEDLLKEPLNINLQYGGGGGFAKWHENETNAIAFHHAGWKAMMSIKDHSASSKLSWLRHREKYLKSIRDNKSYLAGNIASRLPDALKKKKATMLERQHQVNEKNSQFGTKWNWIYNENGFIKIKHNELNKYLNLGYFLGQKQKINKIEKIDRKVIEYKRLIPKCRNPSCRALLTLVQFRNNISSCSKSCSNKTRESVK